MSYDHKHKNKRHKKNEQEATGAKTLSHGDINARVAAIKALGTKEESKGKKNKSADSDANFNKLLTFLSDKVPECRIAAAEELGKTSKDVAFTHISHTQKHGIGARSKSISTCWN